MYACIQYQDTEKYVIVKLHVQLYVQWIVDILTLGFSKEPKKGFFFFALFLCK